MRMTKGHLLLSLHISTIFVIYFKLCKTYKFYLLAVQNSLIDEKNCWTCCVIFCPESLSLVWKLLTQNFEGWGQNFYTLFCLILILPLFPIWCHAYFLLGHPSFLSFWVSHYCVSFFASAISFFLGLYFGLNFFFVPLFCLTFSLRLLFGLSFFFILVFCVGLLFTICSRCCNHV